MLKFVEELSFDERMYLKLILINSISSLEKIDRKNKLMNEVKIFFNKLSMEILIAEERDESNKIWRV
jgi:hypothetical protein